MGNTVKVLHPVLFMLNRANCLGLQGSGIREIPYTITTD
jgi:hypothetical protein